MVHVKAANLASSDLTPNTKGTLDRKDSTIDASDLNPGPIPFVVVEKVIDKDRPEYGDVQAKNLSVDKSKRAADPDPDFEKTKADSPLDAGPLKSQAVPLVMLEKADDKPAHGGEFDEDVTDELDSADVQAPLFRHESFQDSEISLPESAMDTIEEESVHSSTDHPSSGDVINTPSESQDDLQDSDELGHGPLLSHETGLTNKADELKMVPLFSHEAGLGAQEEEEEEEEEEGEEDEFTIGPLLPHETGFTSVAKDAGNNYEEDEYDAAPLLPHETGFSSYKDCETTSEDSRLTKDEYDYEPKHYTRYGGGSDDDDDYRELDHAPTFSHEQDLFPEDHSTPLLPHERGSAAESVSEFERSFSMSPTSYSSAYPAFGQETCTPKEPFGGSMHSSFFRSRTSSSTLPNKLPKSDAEDHDLHDPGLEAFPVGREQILERVATIGQKLPEDETHDAPTSPQPSVLSQACSSVDLMRVKSYISLPSVREDSEEDEEDDAEVESLPSPVYMSHQSARSTRDRDPLTTPHPDDNKQLGSVPDNRRETQSTHTAESSEADSVGKTDGAGDKFKGSTNLPGIVVPNATAMEISTPPLVSRALGPESELRQRRELTEESAESSAPTPRPGDSKGQDVHNADPSTVASAVEKIEPNKSSVQDFFSAIFGDWKRVRWAPKPFTIICWQNITPEAISDGCPTIHVKPIVSPD